VVMVRSSTGNVEILFPLMSSFTSLRYTISKEQNNIYHIFIEFKGTKEVKEV
jgi:hypothetical protein